ncbi:putative transmembrane protein [Gregarina niphandrodes]|uniref:Transmembrane protein n=1 Tax=Gregarina niphandrodes TaxID=110365 RepID=A0A023B9D4_GRENI|nr:putative transmembrane protein [Gregarina niphandrodes]EZG72381.1 putative transmembrane protein [Gregarina niphandrodes]|eukprot:XP_011129779.1 putative transmembrane protein [Gregarina niphandrodes]
MAYGPSYRPSAHFYKLSAEDVAMAFSGMLILCFITSVGSSVNFVVGTSSLFALSLMVYVGITATSNGLVQDSLLALLCLALQTVDERRIEGMDRAAFRPRTLTATYMFALTGLRRRGLTVIWALGFLLRMSIMISVLDWGEMLRYTLHSVQYLCYGLLLYSQIYYVGTEIHRLRQRPRMILQDMPYIIPLELEVFKEFAMRGAEPPIQLTPYEHVSLLLQAPRSPENRQGFFSRVVNRNHRMEAQKRAEMQRELTVSLLKGAPVQVDPSSQPSREHGSGDYVERLRQSLSEHLQQSTSSEPQSIEGRDTLEARMANLRMRERVWSMGLRDTPADFLVHRRLTDQVMDDNIRWPWHSLEAVIREASTPVTTIYLRQTFTGRFVDLKVERWFLAWKMTADVRLLIAGQRILLCQLALGLLTCVGAFSDFLSDVSVRGFQNNTVKILYSVRVVSYLLGCTVFLASTRFTPRRRQLDWVDLAEKLIIRYRLFALFLMLSGVLDWTIMAEQFKNQQDHNTFLLTRSSPYLQTLVVIPQLLCVPPHILAGLYLLFLVVLVSLCIVWPCPPWTSLYDVAVMISGSAASIFLVSVPKYKVFRCLFATYGVPYLLYLQALRPLDGKDNESKAGPGRRSTLFHYRSSEDEWKVKVND